MKANPIQAEVGRGKARLPVSTDEAAGVANDFGTLWTEPPDAPLAASFSVRAKNAHTAAMLTWSRTVIGGRTAPYDFAARDGDVKVGRIYRDKGTSHSGPYWFWAMQAWGPGIDRSDILCQGTVPTRQEAIAAVADAWEKCRQQPTENDDSE